MVRVESPRGHLIAPARVTNTASGVVFAPFHYGYWDRGQSGGDRADGELPTAANELTLTDWDPVSKQPLVKLAAVRVLKVADGTGPSAAPTTTASAPVASNVEPTRDGSEVHEQIGPGA